jgi:hypothetical protein
LGGADSPDPDETLKESRLMAKKKAMKKKAKKAKKKK